MTVSLEWISLSAVAVASCLAVLMWWQVRRVASVLRDIRSCLFGLYSRDQTDSMASLESDEGLADGIFTEEMGAEKESAGNEAVGATRRIVLHSATLLVCFRYLFRDVWTGHGTRPFREDFIYAAGVRLADDTYVISTLVPVRFSQQTAAGVRVDQGSNIEFFTALDELGLNLVAHCHSHPGGYGPESTLPSSVDRRFQARLEKAGCPAIGLIFARTAPGEGYVRFFGGEKCPFIVEVQGSHVEQVEEEKHVYRLSVDNRQLPIAAIIGM